uniref:Solute carrier family 40 member n=1 Tax=Caenorhabditis japonica TaxID=281687 RepID=A0A8R1I074_CAEJA
MLAVLFASFSRVASEIQRICFTKDWVVVISTAEKVKLEKVNSMLMAIDQSSSLILPVLTGRLLDSFPWEIVCGSIIAYNFASWIFEATILLRLYNTTEELKSKESEIKSDDELRGLKDIACNSVNLYFKQTSWMAGFGLTLLYMTVLGFDNLAASYGQRHGMSSEYIGYFRSFGSLLGLLGAVGFQFVASKVGLLWTVMIGLVWQNVFINTSGVAVLLPGSTMDVSGFLSNTTFSSWTQSVVNQIAQPETQDFVTVPYDQVSFSVTLFFIGISLARFGLWLADPAITQIQQETVPEHQRYAVFTVQTGFCEFFSIMKDIIVILLPFTSLFGLLTLGSCAFVFTGFMLNVFYHIKCGVSCHNKKMHMPKEADNEMSELPERQSLVEKTNGKLEE